mgnify:CR=1 FL=1
MLSKSALAAAVAGGVTTAMVIAMAVVGDSFSNRIASRTRGAKTHRFSIAFLWARIMRSAHAMAVLVSPYGSHNALNTPRSMIRLTMYGTQNMDVIAAVTAR